MKVKGFIGPDFQPYISGYLFCPTLGDTAVPIWFLIDTGAETTTILQGDVKRIGLDRIKLKKAEHQAYGIGGFATTYELPDVTIVFEIGRGKFHFETLEKIDILKDEKEEVMALPFSLLGTDVLSRFKMIYDKSYVILEK